MFHIIIISLSAICSHDMLRTSKKNSHHPYRSPLTVHPMSHTIKMPLSAICGHDMHTSFLLCYRTSTRCIVCFQGILVFLEYTLDIYLGYFFFVALPHGFSLLTHVQHSTQNRKKRLYCTSRYCRNSPWMARAMSPKHANTTGFTSLGRHKSHKKNEGRHQTNRGGGSNGKKLDIREQQVETAGKKEIDRQIDRPSDRQTPTGRQGDRQDKNKDRQTR